MKRAHDSTAVEGTSDRVVGFKRVKADLQRRGAWMVQEVRACRVERCGRMLADHGPACRACGRAPEHHAVGDEDLEWEGKARMATARLVAGRPLNTADHEALDRYPNPRSPWQAREAA